jgi:hypothetical protein
VVKMKSSLGKFNCHFHDLVNKGTGNNVSLEEGICLKYCRRENKNTIIEKK